MRGIIEHSEDWKVQLEKDLNQNVCVVHFYKRDGSRRIMTCTRNMRKVALHWDERAPVDDPNYITVWALEKDNWRRFRKDSVIFWAKI